MVHDVFNRSSASMSNNLASIDKRLNVVVFATGSHQSIQLENRKLSNSMSNRKGTEIA